MSSCRYRSRLREDVNRSKEELPVVQMSSARAALDRAKDIVNFALGVSDAELMDAATPLQDLLQVHCIRHAATADGNLVTTH